VIFFVLFRFSLKLHTIFKKKKKKKLKKERKKERIEEKKLKKKKLKKKKNLEMPGIEPATFYMQCGRSTIAPLRTSNSRL
jgi:hypothetical protein